MSEIDDQLRARLEALSAQATRIACGDFTVRGAPSNQLDELDAVTVVLNMLAEDFALERTRREHAEELLHDAVDGYEHAPGMFCSVDAAGNLVKCNATMTRRLGHHHHADLVGKPLTALYRSESRDLALASLAALAMGRPIPAGDHLLVGADGANIVALLEGSLVRDAQGKAQRMRLVYRDVTIERQLEGQLAQAQKMESIGRLAGGIAHDFNNLLTIIIGTSQLLRTTTTDPVAIEDLDEVLSAGTRAAELTSQLLAFSRRTSMRPVTTNVNDRLASMHRLLGRSLGEQVTIRTAFGDAPWPVFIDPVSLEQVIINLALNARDAMPDGGCLTFTTRNQLLDDAHRAQRQLPAAGEYVELSVSDDGIGMSPDVLEHIFEPFFTTKELGKGTGLGLAMVYGVIRQVGGSVLVESEPGRGTTFRIYLPRSREVAVEPTVTRTLAAGGTERILVVEDEASVRALMLRTLRRAGYQVAEACDGQEAFDLLAQRAEVFDLIITDLRMPRLGGRALVERLVQHGLARPTLFTSGFASDTEPLPLPFLQKPFTPSEVLHTVREVLDSTRSSAAARRRR